MRRIGLGDRRAWIAAVVALLVMTTLVAVGVSQRDALEQRLARQVAGAPATTSYPAPGAQGGPNDPRPSASPSTRRTRAAGRNRRRPATTVAPPTDVEGRSVAPTAGGRADGATLVVGLGDSIPAGANCQGCTTYVDQVGRRFAAAEGRGAVIYNYAVSGITTGGVIDQLGSRRLKARLGQADLVLLTIGANDLDTNPLHDGRCAGLALLGCYQHDLATMEGELRRIEGIVTAAMKPGARLVVTGYWNVFTDGAVGHAEGPAWVDGSDTLTLRANTLIGEVTRAAGGRYVDVRPAFRGSDGSLDPTALLADDGDHLSQAGHDRMADTIMGALG